MVEQPSLFNPVLPTRDAIDRARIARQPRVEFLAGLLAVWTLGDRKPSKGQRRAFEAIAEQALAAVGELALTAGPEKPAKSEGNVGA